MKDIARRAGVSTATVGRVLHNKGYVSDDARERVNEAVKELGYVPNSIARALTTKRSNIIGCLMIENASNPHQDIHRSLMAAAERKGYRLLTMQSRVSIRDEDELIRQFIELRVDGLVVIANINMTEEQMRLLRLRSIPVVMVERTYSFDYVDNICFRDMEAAHESTKRFLEKGHRRVAFLGPKPFAQVEADRLEGFQRAMEEEGIPRDQQILSLTETYGVRLGREGMERLLALPERPTAVFCTADILAAGAMQALYAAGLHVPEDMSISGYDNRIAQELAPPINSVEPDMSRIGDVAMDLLLQRMEEPDRDRKTEYLDMRYVERGTITE